MTHYYISERSREESRQRSRVASRRPSKRRRERIGRTHTPSLRFRIARYAFYSLSPPIHLHLVRPRLLARHEFTTSLLLALLSPPFSLNVTSIRAARVTSFNGEARSRRRRCALPIVQKASLGDVKLIAAAGQTRFVVMPGDLLETCAGSYV